VSTTEDSKSQHAVVTVVIPTFNRGDGLKVVLAALSEQTEQRLHVIVVDNSSTDHTPDVLKALVEQAWGDRLQHIVREPNGPASARNTGLNAAKTEFVLFLDSDVELASDWVELALEKMDNEPLIAAVGGQIIYNYDRSRVNAYGGDLGRFGLAWDIAEGAQRSETRCASRRIWINCSAMLARKNVVLNIGGFDEQFFYGYEDSDIGWKLNLAGFHVWVFPDLNAYHHVDSEALPTHPEIVFHYCKNRLRSVLKNASPQSLCYMMAGYLAYTVLDVAIRRPRLAKLKALGWNARFLAETLMLRKQIQSLRKATDSSIFQIGERRWLPPTPLRGLRRRQIDGVVADKKCDIASHKPDDRV